MRCSESNILWQLHAALIVIISAPMLALFNSEIIGVLSMQPVLFNPIITKLVLLVVFSIINSFVIVDVFLSHFIIEFLGGTIIL